MNEVYRNWIGTRQAEHLGTNFRSGSLPFINWYRFKEAYSPEIVAKAIESHPSRPELCVDPFCGSGTTALTSQMLGIPSKSYEVNPFLYDLAVAKTTEYDFQSLLDISKWFSNNLKTASKAPLAITSSDLPPTFVEPGVGGRWIFDLEIAQIVEVGVKLLDQVDDNCLQRILKVIFASCLVPCSNVVINGKGRRYRRNWKNRQLFRDDFIHLFQSQLTKVVEDVRNFNDRHSTAADIQLADIRKVSSDIPEYDLSVFSPPYPNSFDYTDVYNIELWVLGYLRSKDDNRSLRQSTLSSHVQVSRDFSGCSGGSETLSEISAQLEENIDNLWDRRIPNMIASYFGELQKLLCDLAYAKKENGRIWIVVGNSKYAGVEIKTDQILTELGKDIGLRLLSNQSDRLMRSSPQQGGKNSLRENIIVFE